MSSDPPKPIESALPAADSPQMHHPEAAPSKLMDKEVGPPDITPGSDQSEAKKNSDEKKERAASRPAPRHRPALYLAEFDSAHGCLQAAQKLHDAGYRNFDTHTPFPIHGMDKAMGLKDSRLGWLVFIGGLSGVSLGWLMMWWMNGIDYPLIIGGKPPYSLPSQVPIMFEITVLLSCLTAVFGMLHLNRLPRHHHPIFNSNKFGSFSDNKFWVSVEVEDPKFHIERTKALLEACHPGTIELVLDEDGPKEGGPS